MDRRPAPPRLTRPAARQSYAHGARVCARLREAGHDAWLVGGGVRDLLLGRTPSDWDVATSAEPDQAMALWPHAVPTGMRHGTVTVHEGGEPIELTTYRLEGPYTDGRRPDWVRFEANLEEDLRRRDFTVNAMALDPGSDTLVCVDGALEDLEHRVLRTVGSPAERFGEDALRLMRAARFAATLEFALDPQTEAAMAPLAATLEAVAAERIRDELLKLLGAPRPSVGLEILRRTGLLGHVLPELLEGVGVSQNRYHAYPVYEHTLHAVDAAPADQPRVRLAALLHDVGKPRTRREVDGEGTFHRHEVVGARMADEVLDRLRFSGKERRHVVHLVREHMFHYTPEWTDGAVRRFLARVGRESLPDLFTLRRADRVAAGMGKDPSVGLDELQQRIEAVIARDDAVSIADLAVDGRALMEGLGVGPGPQLGRLLGRLLDRVIEDPGLNTRERLLEIARTLNPMVDDASSDE